MREAVIVSTARTPIGKAFRGAFNNTKSPTMMAHAIRHATERAGVEGEEIDDVIVGSVLNAGSAANNVARTSLLAAGLPVSVPGQTIDRQCSSGLMAVAYWMNHGTTTFWPIMNGGELAALYCFVFLFLFAHGGGEFSIDGWLRSRR